MSLIDYRFDELKSATDVLEHYPGTWLYQRFDSKKHSPTDFSLIKKNWGGDGVLVEYYLQIVDGALWFFRPMSAIMDNYYGHNLNPRIEVVPGPRLPKYTHLVISYEVCLMAANGHPITDAIVFQLMHHSPNAVNSTLPVFALHVRDDKVQARREYVQSDGSYHGFEMQKLAPLQHGYYNFVMEVYFDTVKKGYIKVSLEGKEVYSRTNVITCSTNTMLPQLQFGIYGKPGNDEYMAVRKLKVQALPSALAQQVQ
jgi:hypothetical protein